MPDDIFNHHNGIIDQDADRENQGKQGDPIESVAVEIEDQQSKGES